MRTSTGHATHDPIQNPDDLMKNLERLGYIADRSLATSIYLIAKLQKPLLIEGHAGLGRRWRRE